jgi:anti-sigma-K factor RskA
MNHSTNNGDESLLDERMTDLRERVPSAAVESRLQLRMRSQWDALSETGRSERSRNIHGSRRIWRAVGAAAALLFLAAILLIHHENQVAEGSRTGKLKSMETKVEFTSVVTKETDPCNILPPLPDWHS